MIPGIQLVYLLVSHANNSLVRSSEREGGNPKNETKTYSQMLRITLISRSAPQPAMMKTPRGGTVVAAVVLVRV